MKKYLCFIILFSLIFMCACTDKTNEIESLKCCKLSTIIKEDPYLLHGYKHEQALSLTHSLEDLHKKYRLIDRKDRQYMLIKTIEPDGALIINYEDMQFMGSFYITKLFDESDFSELKEGQSTISDVKKIDPSISPVDLDACWSFHALKDGRMIDIIYDEQGIIKSMFIDDIQWDSKLDESDKSYILSHF